MAVEETVADTVVCNVKDMLVTGGTMDLYRIIVIIIFEIKTGLFIFPAINLGEAAVLSTDCLWFLPVRLKDHSRYGCGSCGSSDQYKV